MCTVTAIPGALLRDDRGLRLRVVFNRDERRLRRQGLPPSALDIAGRRVLMPLDGEGGGTWIAVNDAGLVFVLLNVTDHVSEGVVSTAPGWSGRTTRGAIIPSLAGAADLDQVSAGCATIDPGRYAPFDLLCLSAGDRLEARSDGARLTVARRASRAPWLRASSSLGDRRVVEPRRRLFDAWFRHAPFDCSTQDRFHRHGWAAHRELSVLMERPDARTVSITTVEVGPRAARIEYVAV